MVKYWEHEEEDYLKRTRYRIFTRFELAIYGSGLHGHSCLGDQTVENIRNVFQDGFGIKWSEIQCEIFEIFLQACFPLIYGDDWPEHTARVLQEHELTKDEQFAMISMARRNGKTFVTSGTAAAILLCCTDKNRKGVSIAIFSK